MIAYEGINITDIIEKPQPKDAPSMKGSAGIYIISAEIFSAIRSIRPGLNNEYQIADAFRVMIDRGRKVVFKQINGYHIDVGTPEDLKEANRLYYQQDIINHS